MKGRVENWRDIPGYNGWYQISTEGRVRSYKAHGTGKRLDQPKELHPRLRNTSHGPYLVVTLKPDAKTHRTHTMTRLMAETWLKNLPPDYIIYLKNGNPADVSLSNMVVGTKEGQRARARAAFLPPQGRGSLQGFGGFLCRGATPGDGRRYYRHPPPSAGRGRRDGFSDEIENFFSISLRRPENSSRRRSST